MKQRIRFALLMLKSNFHFLGAIMKCQKCSESEVLHEAEEAPCYANDRMALSKVN